MTNLTIVMQTHAVPGRVCHVSPLLTRKRPLGSDVVGPLIDNARTASETISYLNLSSVRFAQSAVLRYLHWDLNLLADLLIGYHFQFGVRSIVQLCSCILVCCTSYFVIRTVFWGVSDMIDYDMIRLEKKSTPWRVRVGIHMVCDFKIIIELGSFDLHLFTISVLAFSFDSGLVTLDL